MNKLCLIAFAAVLALSLGCSPAVPEQIQEDVPTEVSGAETQEPVVKPHPEGGVVVADARMYRGEVSGLAQTGDGLYTMTLTQAEGADFGFESLQAAIDGNTQLSFDAAELAEGDYLEAYYGGDSQPVTLIAANKLRPAEKCVYNGEFVGLRANNTGDLEGTMVIKEMDTDFTVRFSYGEDTQFYVTGGVEALQPGDKLNIYHQGVMIASEPPQGYALEVRMYE